jgi:hypothetical protein
MVVCNLAKVHTITTALPEQKPPGPAELAGVYTRMALAEQRGCQPLVDIQMNGKDGRTDTLLVQVRT